MAPSIWLILAVKVPLVVLLGLLVWWAARGQPDEPSSSSDDDGGIRRLSNPHPRRPTPRPPRRGPHGGPSPAPPRRVRVTRVRARTLGR